MTSRASNRHGTTRLVAAVALAGMLFLGSGLSVRADDGDGKACTLNTLNGSYVFSGTGYNITTPGGVETPLPKAIVESISFMGDGTLTSLATVSLNGVVGRGIPGSGSYTVDENCTGTLTFNPHGPHFDIFIAPNGKEVFMIETDANTVLAGVTRRVSE